MSLKREPTTSVQNTRLFLAFKGYHGFPFALCCSVNEEVVHGFPSKRELVEGDILSIDFGVKFQGFYGDTARTFPVGSICEDAARLLDVTRDSLYKGIAKAIPGNDLYDISRAVQECVEDQGFSVVKRFVGHELAGCFTRSRRYRISFPRIVQDCL